MVEKLSRSRSFRIARMHIEIAANHSRARTPNTVSNTAQWVASAIRAATEKTAMTG
jgi:hypothetical protein